jgi:hypothetical protein
VGEIVKDHRCGSAIVAAALLFALLPWDEAAASPSYCNSMPGTRAELIRTPRADANLELLALALSDGVTAEQVIYERLLRDVTAIRKLKAPLKRVAYRHQHDGRTLVLRFSETASTMLSQRKYQFWDCVNQHYGFESAQGVSPGLFKVQLKGIYDLEKVARVYARVPGVVSVKPAELESADDGATILVNREEDVWHYIFRTTRAEAFYYFITRADQSVKYGGVWAGRVSGSPAWLRRYWFGAE